MNTVSLANGPNKARAPQVILTGGLFAGALDLAAALINTAGQGRSLVRMLQAIASGVLGADAFAAGMPAVVLCMILHFSIAAGATAVYYAASRKLAFLLTQTVVCGLSYGVAVYACMNSIVVPLSRAPFEIPYTLTGLTIHILCVGIPIALAVRRCAN